MCGGCGGLCGGGGGRGGGTVNIIFIVTYARHQQLLFSLKIYRVYPGVLLRHFIEYAVLMGLVVIPCMGQG